MTFSAPGAHATETGEFAWCLEDVSGTAQTAAGTGYGPIIEPFTNIDFSPQRDVYEDTEFAGVTGDIYGMELLTQYEQFTPTFNLRPDGFGAQALFLMLGSQTYVPPAVAPGIHTGHPLLRSNRMNTFTAWYQIAHDAGGQAAFTKQYVRSTVTSWHITFAPNGMATVETGIWGQWNTHAAIPTAQFVGDTAAATPLSIDRVPGTGGTFTIYGNSGDAYTTSILSGDITITRPLEPKYTADSKSIKDFVPGPITVQGTLTVEFTGFSGNTVEADFDNFVPGGTSANKQTIRWSADDGNYLEMLSYPWRWTSFGIDRSGRYPKSTMGFRSYNDPAAAFAATSPFLTALHTVNVRNNRTDNLIFA